MSPTDFVNPNPPIDLEVSAEVLHPPLKIHGKLHYHVQPHYTAMSNALATVGRPIVFSICEWGVQEREPVYFPSSYV